MIYKTYMKKDYTEEEWKNKQKEDEKYMEKINGKNISFITDSYAKNPIVSPVDGSIIDSSVKLREHNKKNDCHCTSDSQKSF